jgi:hypothetical protein
MSFADMAHTPYTEEIKKAELAPMTGNSAYNYFASLTSPHVSVSALFVLKDY